MTQHWRDLHRSELSPLVLLSYTFTSKAKAKPGKDSSSKQLVNKCYFCVRGNITNGRNKDIFLPVLPLDKTLAEWLNGKESLSVITTVDLFQVVLASLCLDLDVASLELDLSWFYPPYDWSALPNFSCHFSPSSPLVDCFLSSLTWLVSHNLSSQTKWPDWSNLHQFKMTHIGWQRDDVFL